MICEKCGQDKSISKLNHTIYNIPFYCDKCGCIHFKYHPINGCVFIYPIYMFEKKPKVTSTIIEIPESVAKQYKSDYGVVLGASASYVTKKKKFVGNSGIEVGDKICYDKSVLWGDNYRANDGKFYPIVLCNLVDVWCKVVDE